MEAKTLGSTTPKKPVLSVSARKIKDNAADWHNLILKWETLNDGGFATANNIANMKISLLSKDKIELETSSLVSDENAGKICPEYNRELEMLCEELQVTLDSLVHTLPEREETGWLSSCTETLQPAEPRGLAWPAGMSTGGLVICCLDKATLPPEPLCPWPPVFLPGIKHFTESPKLCSNEKQFDTY
nr:cyclin-dependent kinase 2-interacting protein isoform X2 [Vicugna pacos]